MLLEDRQMIRDVVMRYCRGMDRLNMAEVLSAYHEDGIDHHTGFSGLACEFVAWAEPHIRRFDGCMHFVGNHIAEIKGNSAAVETYGMAVHWGQPADDPRQNFTTGFRYIDHMEKRGGRWAIVERWAVREWTRSDAGRYIEKEASGPAPQRDGTDLLWQLRQELGISWKGGNGC